MKEESCDKNNCVHQVNKLPCECLCKGCDPEVWLDKPKAKPEIPKTFYQTEVTKIPQIGKLLFAIRKNEIRLVEETNDYWLLELIN